MKRLFICTTAVLAVCFLIVNFAAAQSISGDIYGRVLDKNGNVIPNAEVTLTNQQTGDTRSVKTGNIGDFIFATLQPGIYSVLVKAQGFKELEKKDLTLNASERVSAGDLRLDLGSVKEEVTVEANATPVQTTSGERSALLDSTQVENLMSRGRDLLALLDILPGVVNDNEGAESIGELRAPQSVSGTRGVYSTMNMDGISGNTVNGGRLSTPLNMDAVSEVKVLQNSYQAEYGKGSGAIVNVVTKSGGRQFHGAAYEYIRNEALNARNWFDFEKRQCPGGGSNCAQSAKVLPPKQQYRYNTFGYNVGGPIFIPGHFNANKDKAFFFFSQEILKNRQPNSTRKYTVPTAFERQGDFSQTFNGAKNGVPQPFFLADPAQLAAGKTCKKTGDPGCFANNKVPANRIDPNTQALLNIFPQPEFDSTFQAINGYNLLIADSNDRPVTQEILRLDYNFTSNLKAYIRGMNMVSHDKGLAATTDSTQWGLGAEDYSITAPNVGGTVTWVINPTLVNEFTAGWADWREKLIVPQSVINQLLKTTVGYNYPQFHPNANPLGIVPQASFGVSNSANIGYNARFPLNDNAYTYTLSDGISKLWGNHQFKAGIQAERATYWQLHTGSSDFPGGFNFSKPANDSGNGYANALLGDFNSYTESSNTVNYAPITRILEWYVQDTWKALPRLTLDLGVRFTAGFPQVPRQHMAATLNQSLYNPATAPQLFQDVLITAANSKGCTLGTFKVGSRAALNPFTGLVCDPTGTIYPGYVANSVFPSVIAGQFVPPGYGPNPDGIGISGINGYPNGLQRFEGIYPQPRVGFAWDIFGDGKTALRGGFGENIQLRQDSGFLGDLDNTPPLLFTSQQFNGTTFNGAFLQGAQFQSPSSISRILLPHNKLPIVYNTSIGVQREIGFGTVVDVAYVGSFARRMGQLSDLNQVPYGSRFYFPDLGQSTFGSKYVALGDNYLRYFSGYGGYAGLPVLTFTGNSSYHALQTQVTHRFSHGMQFGANWTYSKAMDYNEGDKSNIVASGLSPKIYNYGLAAYDRTHSVAINYLVSLPKVSRLWDNGFIRNAFDGWQVAGIDRFITGAPLYWGGNSDGFLGSGELNTGSNTQFPSGFNTDLTGGGNGWRPQIIGNVHLPSNQRNFAHYFNPYAFTLPDVVDCNGDVPGATFFDSVNGAACHFAHGNFGTTGPVITRGPGITNFNLSLFKNFAIGERMNLQFRAEAYNVFNHPQFSGVNTSPKFNADGSLSNAPVYDALGHIISTGAFSQPNGARDPRVMQFALRFSF